MERCGVIDEGDPVPLVALAAVNGLFLVTVYDVPARRPGEKRRDGGEEKTMTSTESNTYSILQGKKAKYSGKS